MIGSMAFLGVALTSCSKDVAFDNDGIVNQQIAEYEANFIKKYGAVAPNQSWDFSTMQTITSLDSEESSASTRAAGAAVTRSGNKMIIDNNILSWTEENLKPGVNNTLKGDPFQLVVPDNSFTIVPIYQGCASYFWELWMHVDGMTDQLIWVKGESLWYKTSTNGDWIKAGPGKDEGTTDAVEVEAPTITFSGMPVGKSMYFYLKVWTGGVSDYNKNVSANYTLSSLDGWMLGMNVPTANMPANIPEGNTASVIGCEDKKSTSDKDFEDLVFLMYGNPTPPFVPVKEVVCKETKRYLIEDLGAVDDFDFNDVVVDMSNVWKEKVLYETLPNGGWRETGREEINGTRHQEAVIRAMGGTTNFQLSIGGTAIWQKEGNYPVTNMLNTGWGNTKINPDAKLAVIKNIDEHGTVLWKWIPTENNISITVEGQGANNDVIKTIGFPKEGSIPMIIATDATPLTSWQKERVSIPESWFNTVNE